MQLKFVISTDSIAQEFIGNPDEFVRVLERMSKTLASEGRYSGTLADEIAKSPEAEKITAILNAVCASVVIPR